MSFHAVSIYFPTHVLYNSTVMSCSIFKFEPCYENKARSKVLLVAHLSGNSMLFINKQTVNEVEMRILICDDDPLMIEQLKKYCKNFSSCAVGI